MHTVGLFILSLLVMSLISTVSASPIVVLSPDIEAAAKDYAGKLSPLYNLRPGDRTVGGCDDRADDVRTAYGEAIAMVKNALSVLDDIQSGRPGDADDGGSFVEEEEWDRQATLVYRLFNIVIRPHGGIAVPKPDQLQNGPDEMILVENVFKAIIQDIDNPNPRQKFYVSCSTANWKHFEPTEMVPGGTKTWAEGGYRNGAYFDVGDGGDFVPIALKAELGDLGIVKPIEEVICEDNTAGFIISETHEIYLCDALFDRSKYWNPAPDQSRLQPGYEIDEKEPMSTILLHEFTHAWTDYPGAPFTVEDMAAVEYNNGPTPQFNGGQWTNIPPKREEDAYGWSAAINLARYYPNEAIENADNYAMFALALWYDEWEWDANGQAQEIVDPL